MNILRLRRCVFCRKPGRWLLQMKVYPKWLLLPGVAPELVTRLDDRGQPPLVCEHHMLNMPGRPAELWAQLFTAWDAWGVEKYGADFQGFDYESARWHFERCDGAEAVPGVRV